MMVTTLSPLASAQTLDVSRDIVIESTPFLQQVVGPAWKTLQAMPAGTELGTEQSVPSFPDIRVFSGPFDNRQVANQLRASSSGLSWVPRGDSWVVGEVVPGSPGDAQGVQIGDILIGYARTPAQLCLIQQPVQFQIDRAGQRLNVILHCSTEEERPQIYATLLNSQTGYLRVYFVKASYGFLWLRISNAIDTLKAQGMTSLVLDLRGTTGGDISSIREAADLFLDHGVIVQYQPWAEAPAGKAPDPVEAQDGQLDIHEPMVVLIDQDTNNGGKLLAAALQENGRAKLLGKQTAGGCVIRKEQPFFGPRRDDGSFPLVLGFFSYPVTIWLTPSGKSVCGHGLTPDVSVDQQGSHRSYAPDPATDRQLTAAVDLLNTTPWNLLTGVWY